MKNRLVVAAVVVVAAVGVNFLYRTVGQGAGVKDGGMSTLVTVEEDDPDVEKAILTARKTVDDFIKRFEHPQSGDENFSVKKEFKDNGQSEHIWITEISYKNGVFSGQVGNEPQLVSNVRFGETVSVHRKEISDWMWLTNGKMHGGYTVRALLKNMPKADADALRQQLQLE